MSFVVFQSPVKVKQFFWDVKDRRTVERGIGGYYNADTTAVSTTSTTRVNLKTYTFTSSANTNKIRVRVYAYVSGAVSGSSIYLNINGTDVVGPVTVTETSATLKIDYIGDIPSSTSMTVKVDGVAETGYTLYVSKVVIIAGFGLTSTTSVSILSITLDSADVYTLNVNGNFNYSLKIFYWLKANRKTTANATITSTLTNDVAGSDYLPSAGDDGDNVVFLSNRKGDYASSFTISGYVGASGDVIIIVGVYCQISLSDTLDIHENGALYIIARVVNLDGRNIYYPRIFAYTQNGFMTLWQPSQGLDVLASTVIPSVNISAFGNFWLKYSPFADGLVLSVTLYLEIIVIGV